MGVFILWIALSIVLGIAGNSRKIGGTGAFFLSLLLSPLIGFVAVLFSDKKEPKSSFSSGVKPRDVQMIWEEEDSESNKDTNQLSIADEINKLKKLMDDGILTEEEFVDQKTKLLK